MLIMLIVAEEETHLKCSTWNTTTYAPPMYLIVYFSFLMSSQVVQLAVLPLYYVFFICLSNHLRQAEDASINKLLRPLLCACRLSAYNLVNTCASAQANTSATIKKIPLYACNYR